LLEAVYKNKNVQIMQILNTNHSLALLAGRSTGFLIMPLSIFGGIYSIDCYLKKFICCCGEHP
jgi:hypothetical protein